MYETAVLYKVLKNFIRHKLAFLILILLTLISRCQKIHFNVPKGNVPKIWNKRYLKLDHKNKKPRHVAEIPGTNFFHVNILNRTNIQCQNGQVLPPAQVFFLMVKFYLYFQYLGPLAGTS
jgi:hypothetical protein